MGACGSDIFEKLGPEFGKFVAVEKGKKFLDEKVSEVKNTLAARTQDVKKDTLGKINEQEKNLLNKVKSTVAQIDKSSPQTLDQAAALHRKSKQDLLGGSQIKQKFNQLRDQLDTKFKQQQKKIMSQIDNQSTIQKQVLQSQRPKIPIYDQLSTAQQQKVFSEGEKKFADQIRSQEDAIRKEVLSKLDVNKYTDLLKSSQAVDFSAISKQADTIIEGAKGGLKTTSLFC